MLLIIKSLYSALERSVLEYASVLWNPHTTNQSYLLERVQRKCLSFAVYKLGHDYSPVLLTLQLFYLTDRKFKTKLIFLSKYSLVNWTLQISVVILILNFLLFVSVTFILSIFQYLPPTYTVNKQGWCNLPIWNLHSLIYDTVLLSINFFYLNNELFSFNYLCFFYYEKYYCNEIIGHPARTFNNK